MKRIIITLFGIVIYLICSLLVGSWAHNYEVEKCKFIGENIYIESNCYMPLEKPEINLVGNIIVWGILIGMLFVLFIGIIILIFDPDKMI